MTTLTKKQGGFSLTELLVAMVVGLILLGGLVTLMVNSKKNYAVQDYSARLQENARFAMQFLSYDLRMAGFFGCSNNIVGIGHEAPPVRRLASSDEAGSYGDSVTIVYAHPEQQVQLLSYDPGSAQQWTVERVPSEWGDDDAEVNLVVADCGGASVVNATITDAENGAGESELTITWQGSDTNFSDMRNELGRIYDPADLSNGPIMLRALVSNEYCIATGESGIPALHRETSSDPCGEGSPELVEGVENLQLLYHDLVAGGFQTTVPADPMDVRATQLGLLVRSVSNENLDDREFGSGADLTVDLGRECGGEQNRYPVLNECVPVSVDPPLRGQRKVFNNTLLVRNRRR